VATLGFDLHSAGVLAPGLGSLAQLRAVGSGSQAYAPAALQLASPSALPAQERRRASHAVRLVLACVEQALKESPFPADALRSVFATDEGTGEVCQQMLDALATTLQISPMLFSNSVLNAPSGYFSIAWRNREPATVVSLGLESFASGLLCAVTEAKASGQPVLLVAYDPAMTSPMNELLAVDDATASAWIISSGLAAAPAGMAAFTLELEPAGLHAASPLPSWMPTAWAGHSSARGLAALALLGAQTGAECRLAFGAQSLCLRLAARGAA
jgi:hypothetical protein